MNGLLKTQSPNADNNSLNLDGLNASQGGLFVCTHSELLKLPRNSVLRDGFLCIDELHKFLDYQGGDKLLRGVGHVFALSATLGGRIGEERLKKRFGDHQLHIIDTSAARKEAGKIKLDLYYTNGKRQCFNQGSVLTKALETAQKKLSEGMPVLLFLQDAVECSKFPPKLKGIPYHIFDPEDAAQESANLGALEQIKEKARGAP